VGERQLRLATWNIHMAVGRDGKRDLQRTAQVILQMQAEVIGLQEVDNHVEGDDDDLQKLKTLTGMEIIAGPTMQRKTGDYGNALLTRLPVMKIERYDISVKQREPRGLMIVHLDWNGEILQVAVTHLGLRPGERRRQVHQLLEYLAKKGRPPLVLMGDLNEWLLWGRPLRWLHRHFGNSCSPATFPSGWPLLRLDHILVDPPHRIINRSVYNSPLSKIASDHLPLMGIFIS